jgi:glycosyltransferase involved in cell wall biosynthesis
LIEGSGGVRSSLEKFTRENDLAEVVRFIDVEDQIFNFIAAIDVLVFPAIQDEDFPNVISEAMALSKPVIATKVAGAIEQVLHNQTGLLVDIFSEVQLASALEVLSKDRQKIRYMGELGQQRYVEFYTADKSVKNYERLYRNLLESFSD